MKSKYWFLEDGQTLVKHLIGHHDNWLKTGSNTMSQNWTRNSIAYYSSILEASDWASALGYAGEDGELVKMVVPQARSFIRQIVSLATKQRLFFKSIAENTDADVLHDTRIANALCEQIVNDQSLDRKREYNVEAACVHGMAFYKATWRSDRGTPFMGKIERVTDDSGNETESTQVIYDGDLEISTPSVHDVYWDTRVIDHLDHNWKECRTIKNRWDMIASFPHLSDEIMAVPGLSDDEVVQGSAAGNCDNEDLIYVFECYHKCTPALPKGRMIVYSDENTIYYDDENPYECIPIIALIPEPILGLSFGYAKLNDLLPAQEMFDMCLSAIATNNAATSVQSVLCPRDSGISVNQIGGVNYIYYTPTAGEGGGAPKALQLTQSAPETFKFAEMLKGNMMELSGINSAVRGNPPAGVTSGTAIATLTANSLEFMNSLSKAEQIALEQIMWIGIACYAKFATVPRLVALTGKGNQMFSKSFVGADIQSIKKIRIITSNPMMNTIGGRSDIAEKMLQNGMIKNPQEYFQILEGAPPEIMYSDELSQYDLIHRENEALLESRPIQALKTDIHPAHIKSHAALLNDPMVRMNSPLAKMILAHMQEHEDLARSMDPFLAAMIETGKMPQGGPPPGGPMPPPGMGGPPPRAHPPQFPELPGAKDVVPDVGPEPKVPAMPAVPTNDPLRRIR